MKTILIVDDEGELLVLLKAALELRGYEVVVAGDAVQAKIELAARQPSLILMDLKMPGIDGFKTCEAIKANAATKDIPIIIISALNDEDSVKRARGIGAVEYVVKPIEVENLIKKIKELLG